MKTLNLNWRLTTEFGPFTAVSAQIPGFILVLLEEKDLFTYTARIAMRYYKYSYLTDAPFSGPDHWGGYVVSSDKNSSQSEADFVLRAFKNCRSLAAAKNRAVDELIKLFTDLASSAFSLRDVSDITQFNEYTLESFSSGVVRVPSVKLAKPMETPKVTKTPTSADLCSYCGLQYQYHPTIEDYGSSVEYVICNKGKVRLAK